MKAQSAIEYLVTYGWMLVAVSIVSGVTYSTISGECVESSSGFESTSVAIDQFGTTQDDLGIILESRSQEEITIDQATIRHEGEEIQVDLSEQLSPASTKQANIGGIVPSEQCNTMDITFNYSIGPAGEQLTNQRASGIITSKMQFTEVAVPSTPEDFIVSYNS